MEALELYLDQSGWYGLALLAVIAILGGYTSIRIHGGWLALRAARADLAAALPPRHWDVGVRLQQVAARTGLAGLDRALEAEAGKLHAGLGLISTLVAAAPLLGLLGTVQGMTRSFFALAQSSGHADMTALAEGIRLALFTTLTGLLVAVVGVLCHALLGALCKSEERALRNLGTRLIREVANG